jgi:hypothetical protein
MSIKGKPDVTKFLEGAAADVRPAGQPSTPTPLAQGKPAVTVRRQKLVELPESIYNALKDRAYEDFKKTGRRVTETEIIIAALSQYLNI